MANCYRPVIVVIKKHKKYRPLERVLELPIDQYQTVSIEQREPKPTSGVTILSIYGDEKI